MATKQLGIVIVSWNTRYLLSGCLKSISDAAQAGCLPDAATYVVENASTDGSAQIVRECFPWAILIENQVNTGFAHANNQAITISNHQYVVLLNSDTKVAPNALGTLVAFMDEHPRAGAAGARLLNPDGTTQLSCHPMLTPWREFWRLAFFDSLVHRATYGASLCNTSMPRQVEALKGACLLLRRQAVEQVGLLDESYFMYTEEVDLCYRLSQAGWELWWVPAARVIHYGAASSRQAAQAMYVQLYRSKIQFFRKFGGERQAQLFKWLLRLVYWPRLGVAAVGTPFSPIWATRAGTFRRLLAELPSM